MWCGDVAGSHEDVFLVVSRWLPKPKIWRQFEADMTAWWNDWWPVVFYSESNWRAVFVVRTLWVDILLEIRLVKPSLETNLKPKFLVTILRNEASQLQVTADCWEMRRANCRLLLINEASQLQATAEKWGKPTAGYCWEMRRANCRLPLRKEASQPHVTAEKWGEPTAGYCWEMRQAIAGYCWEMRRANCRLPLRNEASQLQVTAEKQWLDWQATFWIETIDTPNKVAFTQQSPYRANPFWATDAYRFDLSVYEWQQPDRNSPPCWGLCWVYGGDVELFGWTLPVGVLLLC